MTTLESLALKAVRANSNDYAFRVRHLVADLNELGVKPHLVGGFSKAIKMKLGKRKDKSVKARNIMVSINSNPKQFPLNISLFRPSKGRGLSLSEVLAVALVLRSTGKMTSTGTNKNLIAELAFKIFILI